MTIKEWIKRNEDYLTEIAGDKGLSDDDFLEVLEDLGDRATTMYNAKQEEIDKAEVGSDENDA